MKLSASFPQLGIIVALVAAGCSVNNAPESPPGPGPIGEVRSGNGEVITPAPSPNTTQSSIPAGPVQSSRASNPPPANAQTVPSARAPVNLPGLPAQSP
jgi:hypothetical protein